FCCGGKRALGTVCAERGLSAAAIVTAIEASASVLPSDRDWTREPLGSLIDHIITTYHDPLREELPRLRRMAEKVAEVHSWKAAYLGQIADLVDALAADLLTHMRKEEAVLFPTIRAIEAGRASDGAWIVMPI